MMISRYIPAAAAFGGMCIGLLTVLADFLGTICVPILIDDMRCLVTCDLLTCTTVRGIKRGEMLDI